MLCVSSEWVAAEVAEPPTSRLSRQRGTLAELTHDELDSALRRTLRRLARWGVAHTLIALVLLPARRRQLHAAIARFAPDIVQGLRLPYEGLTVLTLNTRIPRVVSTWGSDFQPATKRDALARWWTRVALPRADGIHVDSMEDLTRARSRGLSPDVAWIYAAANFGVDEDLFHARNHHEPGLVVFARRPSHGINYRGFVHAALRLRTRPGARFVATSLQEVERELRREFGDHVSDVIDLLPRLNQHEFAELLGQAHVVVSPSLADGTPSTVVEALASGARVVAGRLPQLEALNQSGDLLVLVDATNADAIADGIERCLDLGIPEISDGLPAPFSRVANAARFTDFYRDVIRRHVSPSDH